MKKFFNMVELTLAIAVVGIGMVGIMALFPVGVNASRDAVGDNYAADAVEQMLTYIASECQRDWMTYINNAPGSGAIREVPYSILDSDTALPTWAPITNTNLFATPLGGTGSVFCIKQPATGNSDFAAHINLWKAPITMSIAGNPETIPYYQVAGSNIIGATRIYAEVSWPVEKPYSKRTKRTYALELFKQN